MAEKSASKDKPTFRDTLNLPRTDFPIRSHPKEDDPRMVARWEQEKLYEKAYRLNEGKETFVLHDGPPYANGHIHLGTAYNKTLKDIAAKSRRMAGYHVPVIPGWDCHGLPIEIKVTKEHPSLSDPQEVRDACREYAQTWLDIQRDEFRRLGIIMAWDHPYKTMDFSYEATVIRVLARMVREGYIEKKNKTVPWCASCHTVLATVEIEYYDRKDPSLYVQFPLDDAAISQVFPELVGKPVSLLVWTTTPWTLPLNRAVLLKPNAEYVVLEHKGAFVVVGNDVADSLCARMEIKKKIVARAPAAAFAGMHAQHPFIVDQRTPIVLEESVSLEDGTACVHSAPGCGPEDYEVGVRNNLEIFSPLSTDGKYTAGIQPTELKGMSITDGQIWVLRKVKENGSLFFKNTIKHSYPHCWRCRNGLMFRATKQWFCNLVHRDLKAQALDAIETMGAIPGTGRKRLYSTVEGRLEWCLSRQRVWGTPIPALLDKKSGKAYMDADFMEAVADGVEKEGVNYWFKTPIDQLVPDSLKGMQDTLVKEQDILDVWFDAGSSQYAVLKPHGLFPADLYLEGSDQHRGWFQSSLLISMILNGKPPTKSILTHGYTVDEKGRKMSKSLGNVITPDEVINELGTDGLRLWAASVWYGAEVVYSPVVMRNVREVMRKVRNTCRFLLSNVYDFSIADNAVSWNDLLPIDQYALAQLDQVNNGIQKAYEEYQYTSVYRMLADYCAGDLSSYYLDIIKDRLYCDASGSRSRRSAQTVCWSILDTLTRLMAPIMSFTAEQLSDLYQADKRDSIHLQQFVMHDRAQPIVHKQWDAVNHLREAVLKAIEQLRADGTIKHSLEAHVTISIGAQSKEHGLLTDFFKHVDARGVLPELFLKEFFIVSRVVLSSDEHTVQESSVMPGVFLSVAPMRGNKCPRCWQWSDSNNEHYVCQRCVDVVAAQ